MRYAWLLVLVFLSNAHAQVMVRANPFGFFTGTYELGADFAVAESLTVGPDLIYQTHEDGDEKINLWGAGIRSNYYFGRPVFSTGFYFGISAEHSSVKVEDEVSGDKVKGDVNGTTFTSIVGYNWVWNSFMTRLGIGPYFKTYNADIPLRDSDGHVRDHYEGLARNGVRIEAMLGLVF